MKTFTHVITVDDSYATNCWYMIKGRRMSTLRRDKTNGN